MSVNSNHISLRKRSNQVYYVSYYRDGKRHWKSTGATVKADALKALTQFRELLQERARSVSFQQFVTEFLAYGGTNYSFGTLKLYKFILGNFAALFKDVSLRELNAQHIDRYKAKRLREISPATVNIELRALKSALNTARRWKLLNSNPFEGVSFAEVPEHAPLFFSRPDFERLLQCIRENWLKEIVVFATLTGLRRGELVNLRWQEVDLERRVILIQSNPNFRTKQGKRRVIPLSDTAYYLLQNKHGKDSSEFVFSLNGKKIYIDWLTHAFKKAVREAKLKEERLHFHSLRHTFASWLVQDGVSIYAVQKLLGHSSVAVTQVYSHLAASELHGAVNKISIPLN